jgi:hypothetical protein
VYTGAGKNPGKMLVESASAISDTSYLRYVVSAIRRIFDTLRQGIPNISPVSSPAPLYTYRRVSTEEEVEDG